MRKQNIVNRRSVLEAAGDYRIKATLGITGWLHLSVHSDGAVRHLDQLAEVEEINQLITEKAI